MVKINYKSDFMALIDLQGEIGETLGNSDFSIVLKSSGSRTFTAYRQGGVTKDCHITQNGIVLITAQAHNLGVGKLTAECTVHLPSSLYADGERTIQKTVDVGYELNTGATQPPRATYNSVAHDVDTSTYSKNGYLDIQLVSGYDDKYPKEGAIYKMNKLQGVVINASFRPFVYLSVLNPADMPATITEKSDITFIQHD